MAAYERRLGITLSVSAAVFLLLVSVVAGVGTSTILSPVLTPTAYAHLPVVAKGPPPAPTPIPPDGIEIERFIAQRLNELRSAEGLPPLTLVSELTQAARRHSTDMADANLTGHTGSDGSNGGQRMQEAGYHWIWWGEIIGWGFGGEPERMIDWWMNSDIHWSMIHSSSFRDFGVGYAINPDSDWGHYWTVNFGKRDTLDLPPDSFSRCTGTSQGDSGGSSIFIFGFEPCQ